MEGGKFKVGQSKVKQWMRCKYAAHLKHVERLVPKEKSRPLAFGTLIHKCIEEHAEGRDPFEYLENIDPAEKLMFQQQQEEYGLILEDVAYIMEDYVDHWAKKGDIQYVKINGRKAEHAFEIEVEDGLILTGKIDAIGKWKGHRALVEHKSFKQRPSEEFRWLNVQSSIYIRVQQILGWKEVDGTLWDYIWSKPPKRPSLLKSGLLSQAKLDSLPSVVRDFCKQNGLRYKDYPALHNNLLESRENYFSRVFSPANRHVIDAIFSDFMVAAVDMRDNLGKRKEKNIERHCMWCEFNKICRSELTGGDADYIKEKFYDVEESNKHEDEIANLLEE